MKNLIITGLILFTAIPLGAQTTFGARAGLAYSSLAQRIDGVSEAGSRLGFSVAGLANIQLHRHWAIRPEIGFVNQGGAYFSGNDIDGSKAAYNKYNYYSIQIPVNMTYNFTFSQVKMGVFLGPALDFSLFGHMKSQGVKTDIDFDSEKEKDLKSFDLGVSIGLFAEHQNVFFSINAICGVLDRNAVKHANESRLYQNNVTFSLGYMFH